MEYPTFQKIFFDFSENQLKGLLKELREAQDFVSKLFVCVCGCIERFIAIGRSVILLEQVKVDGTMGTRKTDF